MEQQSEVLQICNLWETFVHFNLLLFVVLGKTASINVTISSQNVLNGASITLTAVSDPAPGTDYINDFQCGYTEPDGTEFTQLTTYHTHPSRLRVEVNTALPSSLQARLTISSARNPVILDITSITFADEKRQFYCVLYYYDASFNILVERSQKHTLEIVYSK